VVFSATTYLQMRPLARAKGTGSVLSSKLPMRKKFRVARSDAALSI
jgi:hypothetical protein